MLTLSILVFTPPAPLSLSLSLSLSFHAHSFMGTPPKITRLWLPYADSDAEIVVSIDAKGVPNRRLAHTLT